MKESLLAGLVALPLVVWLARRALREPVGRHGIRPGCRRFGTARDIRRHRRRARVRVYERTFRSRIVTVTHHALTDATARYRVANLLDGHTVEVPWALLSRAWSAAGPSAPNRSMTASPSRMITVGTDSTP